VIKMSKYCDKCGDPASQTCWKCDSDYCDDCALPEEIKYDGKNRFGLKEIVKITVYTGCPICPTLKLFK